MSPVVALTDAEKSRCRYHLNYPDALARPAFYDVGLLGSIALEKAMDNILPDAITKARGLLNTLDDIETKMQDALTRLKAAKADVVTLNPLEKDQLAEAYTYWQRRLALLLGVQVNPHACADTGQVSPLNIRIVKG